MLVIEFNIFSQIILSHEMARIILVKSDLTCVLIMCLLSPLRRHFLKLFYQRIVANVLDQL